MHEETWWIYRNLVWNIKKLRKQRRSSLSFNTPKMESIGFSHASTVHLLCIYCASTVHLLYTYSLLRKIAMLDVRQWHTNGDRGTTPTSTPFLKKRCENTDFQNCSQRVVDKTLHHLHAHVASRIWPRVLSHTLHLPHPL